MAVPSSTPGCDVHEGGGAGNGLSGSGLGGSGLGHRFGGSGLGHRLGGLFDIRGRSRGLGRLAANTDDQADDQESSQDNPKDTLTVHFYYPP